MGRRRLFWAIVGVGMLFVPNALALDITVSKGGNTGPGTLRDAIAQANASPGTDRLVFAPNQNQLTGSEFLIQPTSLLPTVTGGLEIDGTTFHDAASGRPLVRIDGSRISSATWGIVFNVADPSQPSKITNVAMTGWSASGAPALKLQGTAPSLVTQSVFGADGFTTGPANAVGIEMGNSSTIGGAPGAENVVSGNGRGILVNGGGAGAILGNLIGTNRSGDGKVPNTEVGIRVENAFVTIRGNTISGNGAGVMVVGGGSRANIDGNRIGTRAVGTPPAPLGNTGPGISVAGADGVLVGSTASADANTIAYNATGVAVISGKGQSIRGNAIFGNTTLDIDLADDGPTANDAGDGDPGANNKQNFPVIAGTSPAGGQNLSIAGTLDSQPGTYDIDVYVGSACGAGARGLSGGSTYIGNTTVTITGGAKAFTTTLPVPSPTTVGVVTASATSRADGSTSELSGCSSFSGLGPIVVNVATDNDDGACTSTNCSLREAINRVNSFPSGGQIEFAIGGSTRRIALGSSLPTVVKPVGVNGLTQTAGSTTPQIEVDGTGVATAGATSLTLGAGSGGSVIEGLAFTGASGPALTLGGTGAIVRTNWFGIGLSGGGNGNGTGIRVTGSGNRIETNQIANSIDRGAAEGNGTGVAVLASDTIVTRNSIHDNQRLGIDLGNDGRVTSSADAESPAYVIGVPVLTQAYQTAGGISITGTHPIAGAAIELFSNPACDSSGSGEGASYLGAGVVRTTRRLRSSQLQYPRAR